MRPAAFTELGLVVGLALLYCTPAEAQQHRATRLGNPNTRFAPPLLTPDDLRARFRDEALRQDIASILRQWRWKGNLNDLCSAAITNEIGEVSIPVGTRMPFMSSREDGKPTCLFDVLWAGKTPVKAYVFTFTSNDRRYRCVTPKPCCNFYLEDLGPEVKATPALELACAAPAEVLCGRPVEVRLTVLNTGNASEPKTTITLPVPRGATVTSTANGGTPSPDRITWEIPEIAPNAAKQVGAVLSMRLPGLMAFAPTARGTIARQVQTECGTRILGVPAVLLEVKDLEDPVEVGKQVTYVITVTNQGDMTITNAQILCTLPASQEFVSGTGVTPVVDQNHTITTDPLPKLDGKAAVEWKVVTKALQADDSRFKVELHGDLLEKPVRAE
ncbi:MAG: DUF11 domain-containing protein, partial [Candidatus Omnitrophica bacterium]|nr:DUF11 domain-containing protein [Candidatus Omnitrophota bacterium]